MSEDAKLLCNTLHRPSARKSPMPKFRRLDEHRDVASRGKNTHRVLPRVAELREPCCSSCEIQAALLALELKLAQVWIGTPSKRTPSGKFSRSSTRPTARATVLGKRRYRSIIGQYLEYSSSCLPRLLSAQSQATPRVFNARRTLKRESSGTLHTQRGEK